ncbi:MAG: hypothetical protein KJ709_04620, partial [Nanoarchaeota archaeon]|nr:hypothetical protein [Nanoarchaeota archaeon]
CCLAQFFNSFRNLFILKFNLQVIMDYPKPLDTLNRFKGQIVSVDLRDGQKVTGKMLSFDLSINMGMDVRGTIQFIKGEKVVIVYQDEAPTKIKTPG